MRGGREDNPKESWKEPNTRSREYEQYQIRKKWNEHQKMRRTKKQRKKQNPKSLEKR